MLNLHQTYNLLKAIIDLGTNTFHLVIAEVRQNQICEFYKLQVPVKLGRGGINEGRITDEAFQRGITTLKEFKKYIDQFEVKEVMAFATSAIRNASNGNEFVATVEQLCNIKISTISGEQEADYIYRGAFHSFKFPEMPVLVMDIGGDSVEFIIGKREQILWKQSFEIGAARLLDMFHTNNPISTDEIASLHQYFHEQLKPLHQIIKQFKPTVLVGTAGSFETLVDVVIKDLAVIPLSLSKHAYEIRREDFDVFVEIMKTSTLEQRKRLKGMVDFRVEMITVAALLMDFIIQQFGVKRIICSDFALKEGVLYSE